MNRSVPERFKTALLTPTLDHTYLENGSLMNHDNQSVGVD